MNKKIFFSFAIFVFLFAIFAAGVQASSVTGALFWDSVSGRDLTISDGGSATYLVSADSIFEDSMTIKVDLVDSSGRIVSNLLDVFTKSDSYTNDLILTKPLYKNPGDYKIKLKVTAASGKIATDELNLKVSPVPDTTSPYIKITDPIDGKTYNSNKTQLVATITDDHLSQCWYNLGDGDHYFSCVNGTNVINSISSKQGLNTWTLSAKDDAGHISSDVVTFTVKNVITPDTTNPVVKITYPVKNAVYTDNIKKMKVTITEKNLKYCWYDLGNGGHYFSCSEGVNVVSGISSNQGSNIWEVYAEDKSGNVGSSYVVFTVKNVADTTSPIVTIKNPEAKTYSSPRTNLTFNVYDTNLKSCSYSLDGGTTYTKMSFVSNGLNTVTGISSSYGSNTWKVKCDDISGNVGSNTVAFSVIKPKDTTAPFVKITDPVNTVYNSNRTSITVSVSDNNLDKCWYNLGGPNVPFNCHSGPNVISGLSSNYGSNTWKVYAEDKSGNVGYDTVTFTVKKPIIPDTTKPAVNIVYPINNAIYTHNITKMEVTIIEENLEDCWYYAGNSPVHFNCVNGTNTILGVSSIQGLNKWGVYAKDKAGNVGIAYVKFIVKNPTLGDTTAPIVKITDPSQGGTYSTKQNEMTIKIIEENLDSCWYNVRGSNITFSCTNGTNILHSLPSNYGINTWKVYAKDAAGNVGMDSVTFTVKKESHSNPGAGCTRYLNETILQQKKNFPGNSANNVTLQLNLNGGKPPSWDEWTLLTIGIIMLIILTALLLYSVKRK